jgi:predicted RNA-binding protein with RPS1 domain
MIKTKKIGSVLKHVNSIANYDIADDVVSKIGSIVAVKVISVNQNYNKLELSSGRNVELSEGDIVIGVLGNRLASTGA